MHLSTAFSDFAVRVDCPKADMIRLAQPGRSRHGMAALLMGAAIVMSTASLAQGAGCNWPHERGPHSTDPGSSRGHFDLLEQYGALAEDEPTSPPPTSPCSGLSCSERRPTPLVPPEGRVAKGPHDGADLVGRMGHDRPLGLPFVPSDDVLLPQDGASSIFHPPRPSRHA